MKKPPAKGRTAQPSGMLAKLLGQTAAQPVRPALTVAQAQALYESALALYHRAEWTQAEHEADALLGGAIKFEGEMLDPPMFGKALQTLLRANALRALGPEDTKFALTVMQMLPTQVISQNWPYGLIL